MAELDEKLNAFLSDPNSMAQVMQLAQQLSGGLGDAGKPPVDSAPPPASPSLLDGLDPQLLGRMLPLLQAYRQGNSQTMQLLMALRPFLKPEKQEKVERAARLSRLIHVGKQFLLERGDGHV
ncbi:MAG: hypothetical protein J5482_04310 [Oscillospiraceae bacterium]|nr:hypothetical protein [Oscillospiraceae bacterium]